VGFSFVGVTNVGFLSFTDVALIDGCRDNHVLIFCTNIYYRYTEHTNELSLKICRLLVEEGLPFARLALRVSSSLSVCRVLYPLQLK
jgi:hypothetical protein